VVRKKEKRSSSGLLHQEIFMMQAAKHGPLRHAVAGWKLVSVAAGRDALLGAFREARTE
jgi:hypothetical protein